MKPIYSDIDNKIYAIFGIYQMHWAILTLFQEDTIGDHFVTARSFVLNEQILENNFAVIFESVCLIRACPATKH